MYYFIIKKYLQVITWNLKQNKKKEKKIQQLLQWEIYVNRAGVDLG